MLVWHRHFSGSHLCQTGISIPASGSARYCWSRISPALPSFFNYLHHQLLLIVIILKIIMIVYVITIFTQFIQLQSSLLTLTNSFPIPGFYIIFPLMHEGQLLVPVTSEKNKQHLHTALVLLSDHFIPELRGLKPVGNKVLSLHVVHRADYQSPFVAAPPQMPIPHCWAQPPRRGTDTVKSFFAPSVSWCEYSSVVNFVKRRSSEI